MRLVTRGMKFVRSTVRSHGGQAKSAPRKRRRNAEKAHERAEAAAALGIGVPELMKQRAAEADSIKAHSGMSLRSYTGRPASGERSYSYYGGYRW